MARNKLINKLGSTQQVYIGLDVQKKVVCLYHLLRRSY